MPSGQQVGPASRAEDRHLGKAVRRYLMCVVAGAALVLVFIPSQVATVLGAVALAVYLALSCRQFGIGTWVPVLLSLAVLVMALVSEVPAALFWQAMDRMLFLSALIAILGTLRAAAAQAREVDQAGLYLTRQPTSRRYLAMTFGGQLFGVLINFGGLAVLLDVAKRASQTEQTLRLPPEAREARLKRMTLAVIRGFSLIALWSPFGFATNAILLAIPTLAYTDFGPIGFAMSFLLVAIGWGLDRWEGGRFRRMGLPSPRPPPGSWIGAVVMLAHVIALGACVFVLQDVTALSFQQALIVVVPCYAIFWSAVAARDDPGGSSGGVVRAARATVTRLSELGPEVGVFASAGFLPVLMIALVPVDDLGVAIAELNLAPQLLAPCLGLCVVAFAMVGMNPIITASLLGAAVSQMALPGLSEAAIALAIMGGWAAAIGLSPFITTIGISSSIVGRSPVRIGLVWNGVYGLLSLTACFVVLEGLMAAGII